MRIVLFRHALCEGNREHRYVGCGSDDPLCEDGVAQAQARALLMKPVLASEGIASPATVYVSPMQRVRQTAALLFPSANQVEVSDLREMDFGDFEGRSAQEMADDAAYRAWVEGMCEGACPNGESQHQFILRTCGAFETLLFSARERGEDSLFVCAHGGTLMAIMSAYAKPSRSYFDWHTGPCHGFICTVDFVGHQNFSLVDVKAL